MNTIEALVDGCGLDRKQALLAINILRTHCRIMVPLPAKDRIVAAISYCRKLYPEKRWLCRYYDGLPPIGASKGGGGKYLLITYDYPETSQELKILHIESTTKNKKLIAANLEKMLQGRPESYRWILLTKGGELIFFRRH